MMIFSEDMEIARSTLARIASYSTSLLDVGKSNRIAYSILSPVGALSSSLHRLPFTGKCHPH